MVRTTISYFSFSLIADHFFPMPFRQPSSARISLSKAQQVLVHLEPLELPTHDEPAESLPGQHPLFPHIQNIAGFTLEIFLAQLAISSAAPRALDRCDNKPASAMGTARCSDNETPACATSSIQPSRQQW